MLFSKEIDFFFFLINMKYTEYDAAKMHLVEEKDKEGKRHPSSCFLPDKGQHTQGEQQ